MLPKLFTVLLLLVGGWPYAHGQIGATSFSNNTIGSDSVGKGNSIGASTFTRCQPRSFSCSQAFIYTFSGNGNWTIAANWDDGAIPPASLPEGAIIIIDPIVNGVCVLNTTQIVLNNAAVIVKGGKQLRIPGQLIIQH